LLIAVRSAQASDASQISGSYQVLQKSDLGAQTRIRLEIHLANRGARDLRIQRLTLWDLSHPGGGETQACALIVHPGAAVHTELQFTIPRSEYELWSRGSRPRLVLEVSRPSGGKTNEVVRLEPISGRKAD
jgi:hypothetical protein